MDDVKKILVVSRSTEECKKAIHYGISLARKYGADLSILHVIYNPFGLEGWNLVMPHLSDMEEEYKKMIANAKKALDKMIAVEKAGGMAIKEFIREGEPVKEVLRVVEDEKIDLIILVAHAEGKIEHFLFSKDTHEMIRQLPCSMVLVKVEPSAIQAPAGVSRRY